MDNPKKLETRRRKTKQNHVTICVGHHSIMLINATNVDLCVYLVCYRRLKDINRARV